MKIKDMMTTDVINVKKDDTIHAAINKMAEYDIGFMVVMEDNDLKGVFTDRDVVLALSDDIIVEDPVSYIMEDDVITINENADDVDASNLMGMHQIRRLVVLNDDNKVVGILTLRDLVNFSFYESEVYETMAEISTEFDDLQHSSSNRFVENSLDNDDELN